MAVAKKVAKPYIIRFCYDHHTVCYPLVPVGITKLIEEPKLINEVCYQKNNDAWIMCRYNSRCVNIQGIHRALELNFGNAETKIVVDGSLEDWENNLYRFASYEDAKAWFDNYEKTGNLK